MRIFNVAMTFQSWKGIGGSGLDADKHGFNVAMAIQPWKGPPIYGLDFCSRVKVEIILSPHLNQPMILIRVAPCKWPKIPRHTFTHERGRSRSLEALTGQISLSTGISDTLLTSQFSGNLGIVLKSRPIADLA
jgi:hypothetical protein